MKKTPIDETKKTKQPKYSKDDTEKDPYLCSDEMDPRKHMTKKYFKGQ